MAAVFEVSDSESPRPLKSLKIDVEVSVAYDADGSVLSHSNAEVVTSIYREGASAKVYTEVGTGYCGDSKGELFSSINFMGIGSLEECVQKCQSLGYTEKQVGMKRTPNASGRHCDCLYSSTEYLPADTNGGTRHENPGTGYAVTLANSNADWRCYKFQPSEDDGCDTACLQQKCADDACRGYIWDHVAQKGTLVMDGFTTPTVMDSSLEYYQRPGYERLDGSCSSTRLCQAYADGILCGSANGNAATCMAISDTLPETCLGTLDSSGSPINQYYYDYTLDKDSTVIDRLLRAIEMCDKEILCVGFNWNHNLQRASFRYKISSTAPSSDNECYMKPPVRYTYDMDFGACSGDVLCVGDSPSGIPICDSTDSDGWTKYGCDNVCLEKMCYREPLCAGYIQRGSRGRFMRTISDTTPSSERKVFVTSTMTNGNIQHAGLTGLAAADGICNERAAVAGLVGTYKAWLSDRDSGVSTRFERIYHSLSFLDTNGDVIADSWTDLTDGSLSKVIKYDEFGNAVDQTYSSVWTYTGLNGAGLSHEFEGNYNDCDRWSSDSYDLFGGWGQTHRTNRFWTDLNPQDPKRRCNVDRRLYCFQQVSNDHPSTDDATLFFSSHRPSWRFQDDSKCFSKPSNVVEGLGTGFGSCMECPPSSKPSAQPSVSLVPSITTWPTTHPSLFPSLIPSKSPSSSVRGDN